MLIVTVPLTSAEWLQIHEAASQQWPTENLSRAEIVRRMTLLGIEFRKHVSRAAVARSTEQLQATMIAPGERRLRD